jgi:predicted nuclease with TOPRIM domain
MGALEERVAYLEGRGEEHAAAIGEVRADIRDLRAEMNRRFDRIDERFDRIDGRFDRVDGRFERLETRFDTRFMWLVGLQFATFMAIIATLLNGYFR